MKRPPINITPVERMGRLGIGIAGTVVGLILLTSSSGVVVIVLEVLLVLTGLDLAFTGAFGHCPLYKRLGYVPRSLRKSA